MKVVNAEQMRLIDRSAAAKGLTTDILMENAGKAVAEETRKLTGAILGRNILILIGPGNNGGDGLVAARYLEEWGANVKVYLCSTRKDDDRNFNLLKERKTPVIEVSEDKTYSTLEEILVSTEVVLDAILGTGRSKPLSGIFKEVLSRVIKAKEKRPDLLLIAVDIPSGLNSDNGTIDPNCPQVDATVTLGFPKTGLYNFPGAKKAGKIIIADIGIPPTLAKDINTELITDEWIKSILPKRSPDANKGTFGKVLIVAGSINYVGAAYLACMGAARCGAGLVTLATARSIQLTLASKLTEVTYIPLPDNDTGIIFAEAFSMLKQYANDYRVLLMGCGLGQHPQTAEFVKSVLFKLSYAHYVPIILDADALNVLSKETAWWQKLGKNVILTPHPGEMSRLAETPLEEIQKERLAIARNFSDEWQKIVVLKGAYTIICAPDGRTRISPFANPGLATAGTGDVLSGIIAGLVAQNMPLFEAAACGVYLHAKAAELVTEELGNAGVIAGDLLDRIPLAIKKLKE